MDEAHRDITLVDVLFDESLLNKYAEQEFEKAERFRIAAGIEEQRNLDIMDVYYWGPQSPKYFIWEYQAWKQTVCKLCEPNPKKIRYYKKLAYLEKRERAGMKTIRPQPGFRERYPRAFADDDPSAPDYGQRITMADVLADDALLDLWAAQQWEDDTIEDAKHRFSDFKAMLIADKIMPPKQILQKFRKDKIKSTGIDAANYDIVSAKAKYSDLFIEDDPDNPDYPRLLTIADVYVDPALLEHYCRQGFVHKKGGISVNQAMEETRCRLEKLRGSARTPGRHELVRYKVFRKKLRKTHNVNFQER